MSLMDISSLVFIYVLVKNRFTENRKSIVDEIKGDEMGGTCNACEDVRNA
jgi:hypothetical protein